MLSPQQSEVKTMERNTSMRETVLASFNALKNYCENESFKGYDPYDGLNSKVFKSIPFLKHNRIARLFWIQLFKKSPINLRPILDVQKEYNPKGLGLFLSGYCNLYLADKNQKYLERIKFLSNQILSMQSKGWSGACWGYNFDWQARAFFQPKNYPTVVSSTFIGYALLDAYDITKDEKLLITACSVCEFILKDLNRTYDKEGDFAFSYSPSDKTQVFNASLLGSRMLARVYSYTKEERLISEAKKSVSYCCKYQQPDGSWAYSTLPFHQWVDNFHTGYNLECISEYQKYSGDLSFKRNIEKGMHYYLNTFFTAEGISKYFNNKTYPVDIHAAAQLIVTLHRLNELKKNLPLANNVLRWTIDNMQDDKGYFYYQKNKYNTSRIPYMRWAQSWMFFGFSFYLKEIVKAEN